MLHMGIDYRFCYVMESAETPVEISLLTWLVIWCFYNLFECEVTRSVNFKDKSKKSNVILFYKERKKNKDVKNAFFDVFFIKV